MNGITRPAAATAPGQPSGEAEPEAMIVVNADGSVRASPEPWAGDEIGSEAEDPAIVPDVDEEIDEGFAGEQDEDPAEDRGTLQAPPGGRIE